VVLVSGDAGLGKSTLIEGLRAHVHQKGYTRIAFRCSPYTRNSALHPVIEHVQRVLGWQREDSVETKLVKLEQRLVGYSFTLEESIPLLAALLSLSLPEDRYPVLTLTPARQREQTREMLVAWMLEEAERQPLLAVWEDLHWADPSTLEILGLLIEQTPTVSMLNVLAFRPEFQMPWPKRSHLTPITVNRLERTQVEALVTRLTGGKIFPGGDDDRGGPVADGVEHARVDAVVGARERPVDVENEWREVGHTCPRGGWSKSVTLSGRTSGGG
jgi:predicted ATPase